MKIKLWISSALVVIATAAFGEVAVGAASPGPALGTGASTSEPAVKPTPVFSVSISGPSKIPPNHSCTWYAVVSGGTSHFYTYTWVGGSPISQDYNAYEASSSGSFYLDLTVKDSNGNVIGTASKYVTVSSTSAPCMV